MKTDALPASRWLRWLAWLPLLGGVGLWLLIVYLRVFACAAPVANLPPQSGWISTVFSSLAFGILCGLIISHQPRNRIGWLCGAIAVLLAAINFQPAALDCAQPVGLLLAGRRYFLWLVSAYGALVVSLEFLLLPLLFPNGEFLSAGWRRFAVVYFGILIAFSFWIVVWPGAFLAFSEPHEQAFFDNPFDLPIQPSPTLALLVRSLYFIIFLVGILIANFSLFARWRRARGPMRQQLKVFAFYVVTVGTVYMLFELANQLMGPDISLGSIGGGWLYMALLVLLWVGFPVAVGLSVLKYRMYDVDIVIRKTLQYTAVTGLLALIYFSSVFLLQRLFSSATGQQSPVALVLSTLLIAALFAPLRRRIQDGIDRRFYRKKYDAQLVLAQFARTARDETDMDALLAELERVIQETLQPEGVKVWLRELPK